MNRLSAILAKEFQNLPTEAPLPEGALVRLGAQCGEAEILAVFEHIQQLEVAASTRIYGELRQEDIHLAVKNFSTILYGVPGEHTTTLTRGLGSECRTVRICTAAALRDRCAIEQIPALRDAFKKETDAQVKTEIGAALEALRAA